MTSPNNTQNDTSELREQIDRFARDCSVKGMKYHGYSMDQMKRTNEFTENILALIAQREQAAELRGRIDENEEALKHVQEYIPIGYGPDRTRSGVSESWFHIRLAQLQATKPEKEGLPDGAVHVKPHKVQIVEPTIPDTDDDDIEIEED